MENLKMLLTDKDVHPLGGKYMYMDELELSATIPGTSYVNKRVNHSNPTTMPGTKAEIQPIFKADSYSLVHAKAARVFSRAS